MIYQLMCNCRKIKFILTVFSGFMLAPLYAVADYKIPMCRLENTALESCENYSRYMPSDRKLNLAYKNLINSLDKNNFALLKEKQLQWIRWRDSRCIEEEEKSGCTNSSCNAVAHDECIINLTDQRTSELRQFINDPDVAVKQEFDFSRKNKYLDDD